MHLAGPRKRGGVMTTVALLNISWALAAAVVVAVGLRFEFRATLWVTATSVALFLSPLVLGHPAQSNLYVTRSIYLAIVGCVVAYASRSLVNAEAQVATRATSLERQRIARTLHDGCVQSLAAMNLRIESCRELLRRGRSDAVLDTLSELRAIVNREHDDLRAYARSLVDLAPTAVQGGRDGTRLSVHADFSGSAALVEEVLQIIREGVTNVRRHAHAQSAQIRVHTSGAEVYVTIDDDGVGLRDGTPQPWSIASRVRDLGGLVQVASNSRPGGHLTIALPAA